MTEHLQTLRLVVYLKERKTRMKIEVPADTRNVTLEIEREEHPFTLKALLPHVKARVELLISEDVDSTVDGRRTVGSDNYMINAQDGEDLMRKLERSRVVDGMSILELSPEVKLVSEVPTLINGTFATLTGTGRIQIIVHPYLCRQEEQ